MLSNRTLFVAIFWTLLWGMPTVRASGADPVGTAPKPPHFPFNAKAAAQYQRDYAQWAEIPVELKTKSGMTFVLIPPGTFLMGSPESEPGRKPDESQHQVTLTKPFYLSRHEVTVGQFRRFVDSQEYVTDGEKNGGGHAHDEFAVWKHRAGTSWRKPGYAGPFEMRDSHPVVHVSYTDSIKFCEWVAESELDGLPGDPACGLPSEAQWEWACRAGSGARFSWGPDEDVSGKVVNVGDRSLKKTHPEWPRSIMAMNDGHPFPAPVGTYKPNAFGLHDMLGNVWEFCSTRSGPYPVRSVSGNPQLPVRSVSGNLQLPGEPTIDPGDLDAKRGFAVRGGGWSNIAEDARCATRNADPPHFCHSNLGFRIKLERE